jgi:polar amino acid transport system permease protein
MQLSWLDTYWPLLLEGFWRTILLVLISGTLGFALAILIGLGRISKNPILSGALLGYTSIIRGTPLLVQIFLLYYGLGSVFAGMPAIRETFLWPYLRDGFWYVAAALILSEGGYTGEVIRAALLSVPRGEIEAGRAFGMRGFLLFRRIWLPRAIQSVLPTLTGEAVLLMKSTALASTVTVIDFLGAANVVRARTFRTYEPLLFVAVGYFALTLVIEYGFGRVEGHFAKTRRA